MTIVGQRTELQIVIGSDRVVSGRARIFSRSGTYVLITKNGNLVGGFLLCAQLLSDVTVYLSRCSRQSLPQQTISIVIAAL